MNGGESIAFQPRVVSPCGCDGTFEPMCCRSAAHPDGFTYGSQCDADCDAADCDTTDGATELVDGPCGSTVDDGGQGRLYGDDAYANVPDEDPQYRLIPGYAFAMKGVVCPSEHEASYRGPSGGNTQLEVCLLGCSSVTDCHWVSFSRSGYCRYWSSCDDAIEAPNVLVFSRDVGVASIENIESPEEGFELLHSHHFCDDSAVRAAEFGPSGPGHTLQSCMLGCGADDCHFVSITASGYCRYWDTCASTIPKQNAWVFARTGDVVVGEVFSLETTSAICTASADWAGPSGTGYALEPCLANCRSVHNCLFASLSSSGVCRYWANCDDRAAASNVQVFRRNPDDLPPQPAPLYEYTLMRLNTKCTEDQASTPARWGRGNSLVDCLATCSTVHDCLVVTHDNKGYCRYHTSCGGAVPKVGTHVYIRTLVDDQGNQGGMNLVGVDTFCTGTFSSYRGPWGTGHTVQSCTTGCAAEVDCQFASLSVAGHCRYWASCNTIQKDGARVFRKGTGSSSGLVSATDFSQAASGNAEPSLYIAVVLGACAFLVGIAVAVRKWRARRMPLIVVDPVESTGLLSAHDPTYIGTMHV